MKTPDVFDFTDYRSFLKAHADDRRKLNNNWSYGIWARQLKLAGTASLTMVVNGNRKPGRAITARLAEYFQFGVKEKQYFEDLIRLEKIKDDSRLRVALMEELKRLHPNKNFQLLDEKTFEAIAKWYVYAIRQATRVKNFEQDPTWIREQLTFNVTETQIKRALELLIELKLVTFDKRGRIGISKSALTTSDDVASEAIRRFHEDVLELAKKSIRNFSVQERVLQASTISFNTQNMSKAKVLVRRFAEDIAALASDDGNSVYQMSVQFFPVLKTKGAIYE